MSLPLTVFACILSAAVALFLAFLLFCTGYMVWQWLLGQLSEEPQKDEDGLPLPPLGRRV